MMKVFLDTNCLFFKNLSILKIAETLQDRGYFNNKNIYDINRRIHLILQLGCKVV